MPQKKHRFRTFLKVLLALAILLIIVLYNLDKSQISKGVDTSISTFQSVVDWWENMKVKAEEFFIKAKETKEELQEKITQTHQEVTEKIDTTTQSLKKLNTEVQKITKSVKEIKETFE